MGVLGLECSHTEWWVCWFDALYRNLSPGKISAWIELYCTFRISFQSPETSLSLLFSDWHPAEEFALGIDRLFLRTRPTELLLAIAAAGQELSWSESSTVMLSPKVHEHAEVEASPYLPQIQLHKWVYKLGNLFICGGINIFYCLKFKPFINSQVRKPQEQCHLQTWQWLSMPAWEAAQCFFFMVCNSVVFWVELLTCQQLCCREAFELLNSFLIYTELETEFYGKMGAKNTYWPDHKFGMLETLGTPKLMSQFWSEINWSDYHPHWMNSFWVKLS